MISCPSRASLHSSAALILFVALTASAQPNRQAGHLIGKATVQGNLIVLELNDGALGKANLFDLNHRTLRFTPDGSQYRAENIAFQWDNDLGPEMQGSQATLKNFAFPFSGKTWNTFGVGMTGSMTFGEAPQTARGAGGRGAAGGRGGAAGGRGFGGRGGGISVDRFAELATAGRTIINTVPAISVFFKPRMNGSRYLKELDDRAVISWSLSEPHGGVQDMYWAPTVNRFQCVLHKDGTIDLSYDAVHAEDGIVGIYPMVSAESETEIATLNGAAAIKSIKLSAAGGLFLKATIQTAAPLPAEPDGQAAGPWRLCLNAKKPIGDCTADSTADAVWTIQGGRGGRGGRGGGQPPRYIATGPGAMPAVTMNGDSISMQGSLPEGYKSGDQIYVSAPGVAPQAVKLAGISSPEVHLANVKKTDGPFPVVFESFHYLKPPRAMDLTCSVIKSLGDKYDMLAYYSDFRIDNPEAGTSSTGPNGGGTVGGEVTGIGAPQRNLASFCTEGRFQWQYIQPVWVNANQMQEYPPADVKDTNDHDIGGYLHELSQRTQNGKIPPYDYAVSQIGHEMGHRWSAFESAKVNGRTIPLGAGSHWVRGLQAVVPFPYQRPTEASMMGGGVWQDNFDGTYTQLDDDYYVPATGYSYLDLYNMGLLAPEEVPEFFILENLTPTGRDPNGHSIVKADRTKLTIQDVIAAEGPRKPDIDHSQRNFNTGMVLVVEHGKKPSRELIERTNGIRERWMDYFETVTNHRAHMTTNPK